MRTYLENGGDRLELPLGEMMLGRDVTCDLRLENGFLSRKHARFIRRVDALLLEDLWSANGTLVDGTRVRTERRLHDGDRVTIGELFDVAIRIPDAELAQPPTTRSIRDALSDRMFATFEAGMPALRDKPRCHCGAQPSPVDDRCASCGVPRGYFKIAGGMEFSRPAPVDAIRLSRRVNAQLRGRYVSAMGEREVLTRDLSIGGCLLATDVCEPLGTHCSITLELHDGPLELQGVVRRLVENGLVIAFADLSEPGRSRLLDTWLRWS